MTTRERFMATGVLSLILLAGGGFLFNLFFLEPLAGKRRTIDTLRGDIAKKQDRIKQIRADKAKLNRWKAQSLPGDTDTQDYSTTRRLYNQYLRELLSENELNAPTVKITSQKPDTRTPQLPGKKPIYTKLDFTVEGARGSLPNLVHMLERFYHGGMLQQIKRLSVRRPRTRTGDQRADDLDITMIVEALVVNGAEVRPYLPYVDRKLVALDTVSNLRGGPFGLAVGLLTAGPTGPLGPTPLARPASRYDDIAQKNIFFPRDEEQQPDVEVTQYVYLTDITQDDKRTEAWLYDRSSNKRTRLQARAGFDSFRVMDAQGETILRGTVIRLAERDVYFKVDDKYYVIHVGQNLDEAMNRPLPEDKVKEIRSATTAGR